jgi:hypothetical protein
MEELEHHCNLESKEREPDLTLFNRGSKMSVKVQLCNLDGAEHCF